jgi:hypothetical protein
LPNRAVLFVRRAFFNQLLGIFCIVAFTFALNIRRVIPAHIGALVPVQATGFERFVNHLNRTLDVTRPVGVLDSEYKRAVIFPRINPCVQRGSERAEMHETCGAGREACSNHVFILSGIP